MTPDLSFTVTRPQGTPEQAFADRVEVRQVDGAWWLLWSFQGFQGSQVLTDRASIVVERN